MAFLRASLLVSLAAVLTPGSLRAEPPSYARQIKPIFTRYCLECHNGEEPKGGLSLESHKSLLTGGDNGAVLTPGKADTSRLVRLVEHRDKPFMPPKKAKQPQPEEIALVRAWIDAGAREDSAVRIAVPDIRPRDPVAAPVAALAYHPSGRVLTAGGRGVAYWFDPAPGAMQGKLERLHPRVTAVAYRPDGAMVAIASSAIGETHEVRLYDCTAEAVPPAAGGTTATTHQDVIHALAFSPDGKLLASCGYDRVIKLWDVAAKKELRVLRDHSDSVYGIAFSPDGKLLASAAADRAVKVWDVATGTRLYTLAESTDWVYAVAWSPDGRHLAAAGVDKSIRVWQVSAEGGRITHSVFAHEAPVLRLAYTAGGETLYSLGEDRTVKAWDAARMVERKVYDRQPETVLSLAVRPDGQQIALGRYDGVLVLLDAATGKPQGELLPVKPKPPIVESEPNESPRTGQTVKLPATINGSIGRAGDVDYYRFEAKAGQEVGVQVQPAAAAKLEPVLQVIDADGRVLTESTTGLLGLACPKAGSYALGIRDRDYRGDPGMKYVLTLGDLPVVTGVFPLGLQRGTEADIHLEGVNLGASRTVRLRVPAEAAPGSRLPVPVAKGVLGSPTVLVDEYPQVTATSTAATIPVPGTANGRIEQPGATQTWSFAAKKGQRLLLEVNASRAGSPLDSVIEIRDAEGHPLPRVTLRCLSRTYCVFRDHDSAAPGIRIEAWSDLAMDEYLLIGGELIRIWALPKNPDDDCQFWTKGGRRRAYLGTTPTFHPMGEPMYKVSMHPPGTTFPPNGLPVVTLPYRNDDGGGRFGKDSRLVFDPPADGVYQVRIGDARGQGSVRHAYQLTVRPPRPDFSVSFSPNAPAVSKGGAVAINISADRRDEFDGPIEVRLENLPPGFSAPPATIPANENSTSVALFAEPTATVPAKAPLLKLIARAVLDGKEVVREAAGGAPKLIEPGDIVTTTDQSEVTVKPGQEVRLTVKVERRNGFKGRIPLDVKGLPHGVHVLDIGLNGILVVPEETTRTIAIYAETWVTEMTHPFVVLARREGKNSEHAAKSVLLRVAK
jgi:dipeptidyl aminopeptidase/acylaminoacyl peptidase